MQRQQQRQRQLETQSVKAAKAAATTTTIVRTPTADEGEGEGEGQSQPGWRPAPGRPPAAVSAHNKTLQLLTRTRTVARLPPGRDLDGPAGDRFKRSKHENNSFQCFIVFIITKLVLIVF